MGPTAWARQQARNGLYTSTGWWFGTFPYIGIQPTIYILMIMVNMIDILCTTAVSKEGCATPSLSNFSVGQ